VYVYEGHQENEDTSRVAVFEMAAPGLLLPFQTHLAQTKPVLPLSNEHGSQVKDQG
jgi:hypothetical protein